jgi:hypothetical protein
MTRALLWKEWREQRWKLAFGCLLLAGFNVIALRSRMLPERYTILLTVLMGGILMPLLSSMSVSGTDRETGTHPFLFSLPTPAWRVLLIKLLMVIAIAVAPLVCAGFAAQPFINTDWIPSGEISSVYYVGCWIAASVVLWTSLLGIRMRTEAGVALTGVAVVAGWVFHAMACEAINHTSQPVGAGVPMLLFMAANPISGAWMLDKQHALSAPLFLGVQALILTLLWIRAVRALPESKGMGRE